MMKFTGFSLHTKYFFKNSIIYLIPPSLMDCQENMKQPENL